MTRAGHELSSVIAQVTAYSGIWLQRPGFIAGHPVRRGPRTRRTSNCMTSLEAARATGSRPCKRCNPDGLSVDGEHAAIVARACRLIEQSGRALPERSCRSGWPQPQLFPSHVQSGHRSDTENYATAHRAAKVRHGLAGGHCVTETIYDAGFNSSGRFYEKATDMLGMTPTQYRAGGANEEIRFAVAESSLGAILVASSKQGVASILLGNDPGGLVRDLQDRLPQGAVDRSRQKYERRVASVIGFIETPGFGLDRPLKTCVAPLSSSGFGRPCRISLSAGRSPTPRSLAVSARPRRSGP